MVDNIILKLLLKLSLKIEGCLYDISEISQLILLNHYSKTFYVCDDGCLAKLNFRHPSAIGVHPNDKLVYCKRNHTKRCFTCSTYPVFFGMGFQEVQPFAHTTFGCSLSIRDTLYHLR
jgi:hypothetical protein